MTPARPPVTEVKLSPAPPTVFKPIQLQNAFVAYRITDATRILMKPEFTEWWKLG